MNPNDMQYGAFAGIAAMALAAHLTRIAGYWLMGHVPVTVRVRRALETLPGAIVVATIAPLVANGGVPGLVGVSVTCASMLMRRNEFLAVALGFAAIALARAYGI